MRVHAIHATFKTYNFTHICNRHSDVGPVCTITAYGGVELYSFTHTLALNGDGSTALTPGKEPQFPLNIRLH